jgi:hypothetical protein
LRPIRRRFNPTGGRLPAMPADPRDTPATFRAKLALPSHQATHIAGNRFVVPPSTKFDCRQSHLRGDPSPRDSRQSGCDPLGGLPNSRESPRRPWSRWRGAEARNQRDLGPRGEHRAHASSRLPRRSLVRIPKGPVPHPLRPTASNEIHVRCRTALLAVQPDELVHINVDVPAAVVTAPGVLPKIRPLREEAATLGTFDATPFDWLEDYALLLLDANAGYVNATTPPDGLVEVNAAAAERRAVLLAEARTLIVRKLLPAAKVAGYKGLTGYTHVGTELFGLARALLES